MRLFLHHYGIIRDNKLVNDVSIQFQFSVERNFKILFCLGCERRHFKADAFIKL